ncbi:interstitial collagenase-like isoform X2 [Mercenaria mercenaria]|uniref:interstitial collagenase-like isoform X2 n=1 Tax=Mercenaria mercenaria TaxID=6596 RepID=UPI00234FAD14|nr:interstitial collagenase-like isoform X2 [Mercenaria mercenaria]XP_045188793.2 interstitial collagenase-like isoform X2 [Mercenaria mercenaria]
MTMSKSIQIHYLSQCHLAIFCVFVSQFYMVWSSPVIDNLTTGEKAKPEPYMLTSKERRYMLQRQRKMQRWSYDIDGFLEKYGYLKTMPDILLKRKVQVHSKLERKEAIRLFQEFYGIKETGKLNKKTVKIMKEPRCGIPDVRVDDPFSTIRQFHFYKYYPRWRRSVLTWRATKYTKKISPLGLWKTLKKAFETWSAVSGLRFLYSRQKPDIQIDFERGNHGDGSKVAFDEKGGVAAHAFGPGTYTISGNIHLDDDEPWTQSVNPKDGINLLAVAIHEIGHALGLQHSRDPRSVMYPAFVSTNLDLSVEDIEHAQILYGPNPDTLFEPYLNAEPTTVAPKICKLPMDDMELGPDGYVYIFRNSQVRQIDQRGKLVRSQNKVKIWEVYEKGPQKIDAIAYSSHRKKTFIFYNNTLWRYTNFRLDYGYPMNISGMPETPKCGAFVRDQYGVTRLLLFGDEQFWEWSTGRNKVMKGYPLSTSQYFEGLPKSPTGALRWKDGYIYFFKRDKFYKVHPGSYNVINGYPKPMPPDWMTDIC